MHYREGSDYRAGQAGGRAQFTQAELRRIFKQMVIAELEGGILRYSRRRALQRYADDIGIPAFDANLLIAEAQHQARRNEPLELDVTPEVPPPLPRAEAFSAGHWLAVVILTALVLDLILLAWLRG